MGRRILVIEDNAEIAELVRLHLGEIAETVDVAGDGDLGLKMARDGSYSLVVLDLMLPGTEGLEICRRLRAESGYVPILMLTAKSAEVDRVLGLEIGADDYMSKPFSIRELVARVKAIFRRVEAMKDDGPPDANAAIHRDGLTIDPARHTVTVGEHEVNLTGKEFELLLHFARNPGRVFSRAQLLDHIWGYGHEGYEHTVNSHINRLRGKIEADPAEPRYILTVWGVGYKFREA
jgi:DNA-binding response OmpR family regulator